MSRVMTLRTALQWTLAAASMLQKADAELEDLSAEDWQDIVDDLRAVADYAEAKADEATDAELEGVDEEEEEEDEGGE